MANEKKIAKNQKHLLYQLGEALKLEEKLSQEQDSKKQAKIQKKIESSNKMILYYGKNIGQEGGTLESSMGSVDRTTTTNRTGIVSVWH